MTKAVLSLSGGLDSTTLLAHALHEGREVLAVGFRYGSKHNYFENSAAWNIARHYKVPFRLIDLSSIMVSFKSNLLISGGEIPEGHYEEESMKLTVVPGRNMIFLSILSGIAMSEKMDEVWIGIHAGDHRIYPDCRPAFAHSMASAIFEGTDGQIRLEAPFLNKHKSDIVTLGLGLNVPFALTRTCYKNQELACKKCGACRERLEAFFIQNVIDPIKYEEVE